MAHILFQIPCKIIGITLLKHGPHLPKWLPAVCIDRASLLYLKLVLSIKLCIPEGKPVVYVFNSKTVMGVYSAIWVYSSC